MAVRQPWLAGLRPVRGSARLMALRWLLFVAAALPALVVSLRSLGAEIANRSYFSTAPDPLPMVPLGRLLDRLPGSIWGALLAAAVVAWAGNQLLTAGAVTLFGTAGGGRARVWHKVFEAGGRSLWAYLRIALTALVLAALGARLIGAAGGRLLDHAQQELWTMQARFLILIGRGVATLCWLTLVGVFAWWCRVIVVADERRRVRRVWTIVPRLWRRRPLGAMALHFLLALGGLLAGGGALFAWRQSGAGVSGWALVWLAVLAGLSFLWHWRLRASRLLWSSPDLIDLRAVPDVPWRLPTRLLGAVRRRPRRGTPPPADPADGA